MMTSGNHLKKSNPSINQQSDKPSNVSHDVQTISDKEKEELKAPLLEEAKTFKGIN